MKRLLLFLTILCIPSLSLISCSKENYRQTMIEVIYRYGSDNMLASSPMYCFPGDEKRDVDSIFYINGPAPDSTSFFTEIMAMKPTGRIDSSFIFAGQPWHLIGPIQHREYHGVKKIVKIIYGTQ